MRRRIVVGSLAVGALIALAVAGDRAILKRSPSASPETPILSGTDVAAAPSSGSRTTKEKKQTPPSSPGRKAVSSSRKPSATQPRLFTGKVVMLQKALKGRHINAAEEFRNQVVLETPDGELIPIVPNWRGRAFYQDSRLRNRKVELVGKRSPGIPYLQVLMVFTFDKRGRRQYTDYWCDVCSIPMYELKPCDCCQAPIHLRFQSRGLPAYLGRPSNSGTGRPASDRGTKKTGPSPQ